MRNLTTWKPSAFFRQLSIGFKLGSAMTLLILVSLSLSGFALWQFREQSQQARELESSWNFAFSARGLSQSVEHVVVVANNLVTSADKEELKGKLDLLANALNQLKAAYANFLANAGTRISEQQKTRMSLDITDFIAYQNDIVELGLKASPKAALLEANDETTIKNREKMISSIEKVSQSTLTKLAIEREANTARSRNIELSLIVFSATGIFLGIIASIFMIATQVRRPLRLITSLMQQVAQGNLTAEIPFVDKVDEIGKMAQALVVFKEALINQARPETLSVTTRAAAQAAQERNHAERLQAAEEGAIVVRLLGEKLRSLASGDLTVQLREDFPTAYLQIKSDFNEAVEKLKETIQLVALSVDAVQAGTQDIASASTDMVRQTDQQTSSLEETVAALDQIIITVRHSAEGTTLARQIAASADADAQNSSGVLRRTIDAMDSIAASAQKINQTIGVIDELAFQTNLLALNAGVEAARAGDAGRGFAVVASEVRALAHRSAHAAKEIKGLIATSTGHVDQGVKLVAETGVSLERIVIQVAQMNTVIAKIAAGAQAQTSSLNEIHAANTVMGKMTQQNAAMAGQSVVTSDSLSRETEQLLALIGQFQIVGHAVRNDRRVVNG